MVCSRVIYRTSQVASHVSRRNNADRIWASTPQNCATTNQLYRRVGVFSGGVP